MIENRYCNFVGKEIIFHREKENIWVGVDNMQSILYIYYGNYQDINMLKNNLLTLIKWLDQSLCIGYIVNKLTMKEHTSSITIRIKFRNSEEMRVGLELIKLENYGIESE